MLEKNEGAGQRGCISELTVFFLPSTSSFQPITPELIDSDSLLAAHGISREQLVRFGEPDEGGVVRFLCEERAFGRERVMAALGRMQQRSLFE